MKWDQGTIHSRYVTEMGRSGRGPRTNNRHTRWIEEAMGKRGIACSEATEYFIEQRNSQDLSNTDALVRQ